LPKGVSNKLTKRSGTANMTSHNTTNKLNKPTIRFRFFDPYFIYYSNKI
jgi:hypothetical protein